MRWISVGNRWDNWRTIATRMVRSRAIIFALDEKRGLRLWDDMTFKFKAWIAIYQIQSKSTIHLLDSQIIFIYRWSIVIYRIYYCYLPRTRIWVVSFKVRLRHWWQHCTNKYSNFRIGNLRRSWTGSYAIGCQTLSRFLDPIRLGY